MSRFLPPLAGALVWLLFVAAWRPLPQDPHWIVALLLFAPLVLMPLSHSLWRRLGRVRHRQVFELPAAALLAPAFIFPPSWLAALAALPWLLYCAAGALDAVAEWRFHPVWDISHLCLESTRVFPAIGAFWLMADRIGWRPFEFDGLLVLLTAAHFHHAGFTLPLIAGLQGQARPGILPRIAGVLILAGVPLVALGITLTHAEAALWVETTAVAILVLGAFIAAAGQLRVAFEPRLGPWPSTAMVISAVALAGAMLLALSYGLRFVWPMVALALPLMWAVHGTLNVFGFGLLGMIAWRARIIGRSGG